MDISSTLKFVQEQHAELTKNGGGEHSKVSHLERVIAILQNGEKTSESIRNKVRVTLTDSFKQIQDKIDAAQGEEKELLKKLAGMEEKLPKPVPFKFPSQDFSPKAD